MPGAELSLLRRLTLGVGTLASLLIVACSGGGSQPEGVLISAQLGGNVSSADGKLRLEIPPGALTEDTTITVTAVAFDDLPSHLQEQTDGGPAFRLEPDGLEFNEPIEVALQVSQTASQDGGVSAIRLITRAGDDDSESLTDLTTEVILGEELITVRGKLNHFSWVWAVSEEGLEVAMEKVAPVQLVGTLFQVRLLVVNRGSADLQDILVVWRPLTPVEFVSMGVLDPGEPLRDAANLDPDETREGFKVLTLTTNRTLFSLTTFRCKERGTGSYFATISGPGISGNLFVSFWVECVTTLPGPTPTSTNTPTPTPTPTASPTATSTPTPTPPLPPTATPSPTPTFTPIPEKTACDPQTHQGDTTDAFLIDGGGNFVADAATGTEVAPGEITKVEVRCDPDGLRVWVDRSVTKEFFSSAVILHIGDKTYTWEFHNNQQTKDESEEFAADGSRVCFFINAEDLKELLGDKDIKDLTLTIDSFFLENQGDQNRTRDTTEVNVN